jgi:ATP-dependent Clp protease ATP-binding subunit ClpX
MHIHKNNQTLLSNHGCSNTLLYAMLLTPYFSIESVMKELEELSDDSSSQDILLKRLQKGCNPDCYDKTAGLPLQICIDKIELYNLKFNLTEEQIQDLITLAPALKTHFGIKTFNYTDFAASVKHTVIGQDKAVDSLCLYMLQWVLFWLGNIDRKPLSLRLLVGPTGSGKTLLVNTVANKFEIGFIHIDASRLTQEGYVGTHVITELVMKYNQLPCKKQKQVIVFIDEFDKLAECNNGGDIKGPAVMNEMLTLFESNTISGMSNYSKDGQHQTLDISNFCFILGGAFTSLQENKNLVVDEKGLLTSLPQIIDYTKIAEYGIPKEMMGRIGGLILLEPITKETIELILYENNENNPLNYYSQLFAAINNSSFTLTIADIESIIQDTLALDLGVRGLKITLEKFMENQLIKTVNQLKKI